MFKDACLSHAKHVAALNPFESVKCVSDRTRILYQSLRSIYVTVFSRAGLFLDTFESTHSCQDDARIWSIRYQRGKLNVTKRQKILISLGFADRFVLPSKWNMYNDLRSSAIPFPAYQVLCFELPITLPLFDFPWSFELSGVDCIIRSSWLEFAERWTWCVFLNLCKTLAMVRNVGQQAGELQHQADHNLMSYMK